MAAEARARCKLVGRELPQLALESTAGPVDLRELGCNWPSSPARRRAVIFDLWDTLVAFPWDLIAERDAALAETLAVDLDRLRSTWRRLESAWQTGPLMPSLELLCAELGLGDVDLERLRTARVEYMRRALQPRREVVETLRELRRRGWRLGLISGCSGDVPIVWEEKPFAGLFDGTVFSCDVGLRKPDIRIYSRAISVLRVAPSDCLYVGDGGDDELAGAARAGMTAVLLRASGSPVPLGHARGRTRSPRSRGCSHLLTNLPGSRRSSASSRRGSRRLLRLLRSARSRL